MTPSIPVWYPFRPDLISHPLLAYSVPCRGRCDCLKRGRKEWTQDSYAMNRKKSQPIKELQTLRNIGPATAEKLYAIGIRSPEQMRHSDPEKLYERLKKKSGGQLDRCVLYQFRGAIWDLPWPMCKDLARKGG